MRRIFSEFSLPFVFRRGKGEGGGRSEEGGAASDLVKEFQGIEQTAQSIAPQKPPLCADKYKIGEGGCVGKSNERIAASLEVLIQDSFAL